MTRDEHMALSKRRALEYLDRGQLADAVTSMLSDLSKHEETRGIGKKMGLYGMWLLIQHQPPDDVRRFIEGFR